MSGPTFALPDQLSYDRFVPSSLGCKVEQSVCTPYTGQGSVYIQAGNYFIINIPKVGNDCCFDPANSYLRFKLNLANSTGAVSVTPSGCIDSIFKNFTCYHGSNVLETIDNYGLLTNVMLDCQASPVDRAYHLSTTRGTSTTLGSRLGQTLSLGAAGSTAQYYSIPIMSGVVGCMARSYIPSFALNGYISFRFTMDSCVNCFVASGAQGADINTANNTPQNGVWLSDIEFHASIIRCTPQVLSVITRNEYQIPTESYNTFDICWTPSTQIEQLLPFKFVSLKTIFLIMKANSILNNRLYYLNTFCSEDIYQYSFRIGSSVVPPNRVKVPLTKNNFEVFEELKKSFHQGGGALGTLGIHNIDSFNQYYNVSTTVNGNQNATTAVGSFIIGQDLEQFSGKSGQIISGVDTTSSDIYFSGTWTSTTNAEVAANLIAATFFGHYDIMLSITDGQMVSHY